MVICPTCQYAFEGPCENPGCFANPRVSQEQKDRWTAQAAKNKAEQDERDRVTAIRRRMMARP